MKKIGYVLSGGGARGFAHLGVIKFLEEINYKPYAIAGTSAGAIAGALYAAGHSPEEIMGLFKNSNPFGWNSIAWKKEGIFSMEVLNKILKQAIEIDDFEALSIKLFITATDLNEGKSVIFSEGKLIEAVIASSSIPIVFETVKHENSILVDGAILNNFPVEPLVDICDIIIGSFVNKVEKLNINNYTISKMDLLDRCFHMATANSTYSKMDKCDVFIEVPLNGFNVYDLKQADKIFYLGYETAYLHKEKLLELIENK